MNQTIEPFAPCQAEKLSSVRSPADGEEQFPGTVCEEQPMKQYSHKMHQAQTSHFADAKESSDSPVSSGRETPAYHRWAENLNNLLQDHEGTKLFMTFLSEENDKRALDFWFYCEGIRRQECSDLPRTIKCIYRTMCGVREISAETRHEVERKINLNIGLDKTIFNQAQKEVEDVMRKTTYPNFLCSDIYIRYVQENSVCRTPNNETVDSLDNLSLSDANSKSCEEHSSKTELSSSDECLPSSNCASKEVASKTSSTSRNLKESHDDFLQTVHEDIELQLPTRINSRSLRLAHKPFLRWNRFSDASRLKPESQEGYYLKSNTPGYNTCYTKYAGYLPPSAQDSELQSLSSDAHTDDSMSIASSSVDHDTMYSNKVQKKCHKAHKLHHGIPFNKDVLPSHSFIPRTDRLPEEKKLAPDEFALVLTEKLLKVLEQRKTDERLNERLQDKNECLAKGDTTAQAILDNHVSRVFKDSSHVTASPSPGCLTPSTTQPDEPFSKQRDLCYPPGSQTNNVSCFAYPYQHNQFNSCSDGVKHRKEFDNLSSDGVVCASDFNLLQSAAFLRQQQHSYQTMEQSYEHSLSRHGKDSSRRSSRRASSLDGGSSSCFDSGISATDVTSCSASSQERLTNWLEMKKHSSHGSDPDIVHYPRKSPTSRSPVFGQLSKKQVGYNNSHSGALESGSSGWPLPSAAGCNSMIETVFCRNSYWNPTPNALTQDLNMMVIPDTNSQLLETKKRLESIYSAKQKMKKSSRKSCMMPASVPPPSNNDITLVAYCFGRASVPFLSRVPGKSITLKQFKSLLPKRGNFRYFFKRDNEDFGVVFEEISDDSEILPLWEGKVFGLIEPMEV